MVEKFRKRPVEVEAMRLTKPYVAVADWCGGKLFTDAKGRKTAGLMIETLEGIMRADLGDWVIKGVAGEFYPCKPDIFAATYEPSSPPTASTRLAGED